MTYIGQRPTQNAYSSPGLWLPGQQPVREQQSLWPDDADPNWSSVVLLIQPTAQDTTYTTDATGKAITTVGTVPITGQSAFPGGAGFSFSGNTSNYLTLADSADWDLGQDWTIEAICTHAIGDTNTQQIVGQWGASSVNQAWRMAAANTAINNSFVVSGPTQYTQSGTISRVQGLPSHMAMTWTGSRFRSFYNGALISDNASATGTMISGSTSSVRIGLLEDSSIWPFNGVIHSVRITKGVARYTANFTPPTRPWPTR